MQADRIVVERRIRNNVLDWLEMVAVIDTDPPPFSIGAVINQWFDWNPDVPVATAYPEPVYTVREAELLIAVGTAMNRLCDAVPTEIIDDEEVLAMGEWAEVAAASERARVELLARDTRRHSNF